MRRSDRSSAYLRAKNKVDRVRGFYTHLFIYVAINIGITIFKIIRNLNNGETFEQAFFDFGTFALWIFWGIGISLHAFGVFGLPMILGRNWEDDKIREFMDQEERTKY